MSDTKENVLLFGLGGIGGIYASILSLSKAVNVHVVARSNYESVKEKGFKLVSQKFGDHDITFDGGESLSRECNTSGRFAHRRAEWTMIRNHQLFDELICIELTCSLEEL